MVVTSAAARRPSLGRRPVSLAALVGALMLLATVACAQPGSVKIGWLTMGPLPFLEDFRQRLRDLGYVDRRAVQLEQRYAGEQPQRLGELATELVQSKVDVIVVAGAGIVASLARPGGNITGLAIVSDDLAPKWMQMVHQAVLR